MMQFVVTILTGILLSAVTIESATAELFVTRSVHSKRSSYDSNYPRLHYWAPRVFIYRAYHQRFQYQQYTPPTVPVMIPYEETDSKITTAPDTAQPPELLPSPEVK